MGVLMMISLHLTLSLLPLLIQGAPAQSQPKTPAWVDICNGTFLFSEDLKNWNDGYGGCELYGAHLAMIKSMELNYCLLDYAHTQGDKADYYWHSANDLLSEGVYRHYDESLLLWQPNWYDLEPGGGTGQNCLMVRLDATDRAGKWWDDICTTSRHYICQRS